MRRAIEFQERKVADAKTAFGAAVQRHLKPTFTEIAERSADAIRRSQIAAEDVQLLSQTFSVATGTHAPTGIVCPTPDSEIFRGWLTSISRLGYIGSGE